MKYVIQNKKKFLQLNDNNNYFFTYSISNAIKFENKMAALFLLIRAENDLRIKLNLKEIIDE